MARAKQLITRRDGFPMDLAKDLDKDFYEVESEAWFIEAVAQKLTRG